MNEQQFGRLVGKVEGYLHTYEGYLETRICSLDTAIFETAEHFTSPAQISEWKPAGPGTMWGADFGYAWFKASFTVSGEQKGKKLWLYNATGSVESLVFLNDKPAGIFDYAKDILNPSGRLHRHILLWECAEPGDTVEIALEAYAGNSCVGCQPNSRLEDGDPYPASKLREFEGLHIVELDETTEEFLTELKIVLQLFKTLPQNNYRKWEAANVLEALYEVIPQRPEYCEPDEIRAALCKGRTILSPFLSQRNTATKPFVGLIGHSHLDTAWLWPVKETVRKAARTFSNALTLMERYPEYTFIQSSVVYLDWMRKFYPDIFEGIKKRVSEGRWEPNGGSWVECDGNMASGEMMIRQFLRGQRFLKEQFNYHADAFWLPDTFGYSAAIPQIMKGFGMKYFLTTKLSWNDTNVFPYDTFWWKGLDGTEVLTHFNLIHSWPDPVSIIQAADQWVKVKYATNGKLLSFGFGDGGGGPHYGMLDMAKKVKDLEGCPKAEYTTVSAFMKKLEQESDHVPLYAGELYVEGHRGTLTQMHEIKRTNRKAEIALRELEAVNVISGHEKSSAIDELYDVLLVNQFHDILPGSSIPEVHDTAISQNRLLIERANKETARLLAKGKNNTRYLSVFNSLSWERKGQLLLEDCGLAPKNCTVQQIIGLDEVKKVAFLSSVPSLSSRVFELDEITEAKLPSPFRYEENSIETPFARLFFNEFGSIDSFYDKTAKRELRKKSGLPLNTFLMGDDIPLFWDNWDIDADQKLKMLPQTNLLERKVISDGPLQLRVKSVYRIGRHSRLIQIMVFYADSPRVDFETTVDWQDKHSLLKADFDLQIQTSYARHEVQFGNILRSVHKNTCYEQAKFEVCNHKWTDLSENKYGVSILNDCKYGLSVDGSDIALTLHKGGCHPDPRGDAGIHTFTYSILPHNCGFNAESVIRPAYELNIEPTFTEGNTEIASFAEIDAPNVLLETIKFAEDGDGYVLRFYEAEGSGTHATVTLSQSYEKIELVNMLEEPVESVVLEGQKIHLYFNAFEIKTIKIYK